MGPMLLGQPKFEDLPPFQPSDVRAFKAGSRDLMTQGQPLDLPVGMPFGDMVRVSITMAQYLDVIEQVAALGSDWTPEAVQAVVAAAKGVTTPVPMPVIPSRVINLPS